MAEDHEITVVLNPYKDHEFSDLEEFVNVTLKDSDYIEIGRTKLRALTRKPTTINIPRVKNILVLSHRIVTIKQSKDDEFTVEVGINNTEKPIYPNSNTRKWKTTEQETIDFLNLLRLSQMMFAAHFYRAPEEDGKFVITADLRNSLEILESYVDGGSNHDELSGQYDTLSSYVDDRLNKLKERLNGEIDEELNANLELSDTFFDKYIMVPQPDDITPRMYNLSSVRDDIIDYYRDVMRNAIMSLFQLNTPENESTELKVNVVDINTTLSDNKQPYSQVMTLAEQILPAIPDDEEKARGVVSEIINKCEGDISLKILLVDPPTKLSDELEEVMEEYNLEHVMEQQLKQFIPGVLEKQGKDIKKLFQDSSSQRIKLASIKTSLQELYDSIEALRSGKDAKTDYNDLNNDWVKQQTELSKCATHKNLQQVMTTLNSVEVKLRDLKRKVRNKSSNIHVDGSVLWLGLGQAGSQILRECLLYCLDNLNDARCSALLEGLGIKDQKRFAKNLLDRKHNDSQIRTQAENELRTICDQNLHIMAMNLGGEIDELVEEGQPGYFLWGDSIIESEYSSIRRKRVNTIKLDQEQDGAGGKTGLGRAYGFAREAEIKEALSQVGRKGGRNPDHIIVTHSFAGGSGSGMVLPVLQMLRSQFDSDAMIWVISVGEGASEARISADFNTPFIISDILQAHYDGIHSPMEPFTLADWSYNKAMLQQLHGEMVSDLQQLNPILEQDENRTFTENFVSINQGKLYNSSMRSRDNFASLARAKLYDDSKKIDEQDITVSNLLAILPATEGETDAFNAWCDKFDDVGRRPAIIFWNKWIECMSDPIGSHISAKEKGKQVTGLSGDDNNSSTPNITVAHIDLMFEHIKQQNPDLDGKTNQRKNLIPLTDELRLLMQTLRKPLENKSPEEKKATFDKIRKIFDAYSMHLESYNKIRRDLTKRVQALSKSSNDNGIKNIIISNAHLERGVKSSGIPVEEATYTVFNAVVFDLIMNIIGSQLPSDDYISGKMEYFDRQDLTNHTKPPMVVGLMELLDTNSLGETFHPEKELMTSKEITHAFADTLQAKMVYDNKPNPFFAKSFEIGGGPTFLLNSLFGVRLAYLLQHNPYTLMNQTEPEKLVEFTKDIEDKWNDENIVLFNQKYSTRYNLRAQGFNELHMVNMLRWITTIEKDTLNKILCGPEIGGLDEYRLNEVPNLSLRKLRTSHEISNYALKSGKVDLDVLQEELPKLGIWTEEVLAAMSPSYLHSYLISRFLDKALVSLENEDGQEVAIFNRIIPPLAENFQPSSIISDKAELKNTVKDIKKLKKVGLYQKLESYLSAHGLTLQEIDAPVGSDDDKILVLRLQPKIHRYLSVVRDSTSGPNSKILPSQSLAGSIARYISPDSNTEVIGTYSAPKFGKSVNKLNNLRYLGLLPGEKSLDFAQLLRIFLLNTTTTISEINNSLSHVAKSNSVDLNEFSEYGESMIQIKYNQSDLELYDKPNSIVRQAKILRQRMIASKDFIENYGKAYDNASLAVDFLLGLIKEIEELTVENEEELFYMLQKMQNLVKETNYSAAKSQAENKDTPDDTVPAEIDSHDVENNEQSATQYSVEILLQIRRLIFDLATVFNEALTQSKYMSKNYSTERVHFQMSGFSDRIIGVPSGMLIQVHTNSSSRGDIDEYRRSLRGSINSSIGAIKNTKEFFTKSNFGPAASVTTTLQQAPVNEAASHFRSVMQHLSGNDPDSYLEETKLHPYVFLYNVLWLSANIHKWTNNDNIGFAKKFIIPLTVIENHYQNPHDIKGATDVLVTDAVFQGSVEVPQCDIRDYESSKNEQEDYRSIFHLVSLMAYRHKLAIGKDDEFNEKFGEEISELSKDARLTKKATSIPSEILESDESNSDDDDGPLDDFDLLLQNMEAEHKGDGQEDTLLSRASAWMIAYRNWKKFCNN
jgi:hypothetical protein